VSTYGSTRPRSIAVTLFAERRTKLALVVVPVDLRASVAGELYGQLERTIVPARGADGPRRRLYAADVRRRRARARPGLRLAPRLVAVDLPALPAVRPRHAGEPEPRAQARLATIDEVKR